MGGMRGEAVSMGELGERVGSMEVIEGWRLR